MDPSSAYLYISYNTHVDTHTHTKISVSLNVYKIIIFFFLFFYITYIFALCLFTAAQGEVRECAFTDQQQQWEVERVAGGEGRVSPENTTIRCAKGSHCFGLWEKTPPGEVRLVKQGIFTVTIFVC